MRSNTSRKNSRSASVNGRLSAARTTRFEPLTTTADVLSSAATPLSSLSRVWSSEDNGLSTRPAASAILRIQSFRNSAEYTEIKSGALFDTEAIIACPNLVAAAHSRILRRKRVQKRSVAAAEVANADHAFGVGGHFEMFAR